VSSPLTSIAAFRYDPVNRRPDRFRPQRILEIGCGRTAMGARLALRMGQYRCRDSWLVAFARHPDGGR
jgi:hypothetical protein